jgi:hypothetical protein
MHKPQALFAGAGEDTHIYVAEGRTVPLMEGTRHAGRRVMLLDRDLNEVVRLGNATGGEMPNQFISPHGIAVDSEGSVYGAEVSYMALGSRLPVPQEVVSLRKWRRADDSGATSSGAEDRGMPARAMAGYLAGVRTDGPGAAPPV